MVFIDTKELTKICGGQDTQDAGWIPFAVGVLSGVTANIIYDTSVKPVITNISKNAGSSSPILRKRGCDY